MLATVVVRVVFVALSYVAQLVYPSNEFANVDSGALDVMTAAGGQFLKVFFTAAYVAGALGSAHHLAGVGGSDPLRDGPRRHPAAPGVRP